LQYVSIFVSLPLEYCHSICIVLGAFGKFRKPTVSCAMSVCPPSCLSVCPYALNNWMHFYDISYLRIFRKSAEEIQISLHFDKNNICKFMVKSLIVPVRHKLYRKIRTHFMFSEFFPKTVRYMSRRAHR